jgi:hypothetical protein
MFYAAAVPTSGGTNRATYNTPAGRRAVIEYMQLNLSVTAAFTLRQAGIIIRIRGNDALSLYSETLLEDRLVAVGSQISLDEGDQVLIITVNGNAAAATMVGMVAIREYQ